MNTQKGIAPLIIALVIALVAGGGAYAVTKNKKVPKEEKQEVKEQKRDEKVVAKASLSEDPKEAYLAMRAEFEKIKTFDEFYAFSLKYGSTAQLGKLQKDKAQIDALGVEMKNGLVAAMKSLMPTLSEIKDIKVVISGNKATLTVSTADPSEKGTVILMKEGGVWKLDNESWKTTK